MHYWLINYTTVIISQGYWKHQAYYMPSSHFTTSGIIALILTALLAWYAQKLVSQKHDGDAAVAA